MDFSKCICDKPGFCRLYQKEMTESPPNWQWCQNATEKQREDHKRSFDQGKRTRLSKTPSGVVVNIQDLEKATISKLIPKVLKDHDISGIVGIPRSGMLPASTVATQLSLPLYSLSNKKLTLLRSFSDHGGYRMQHFKESKGKLLFIDDTTNTGRSAKEIRDQFPEGIISSIYSTTRGSSFLDYYGEILENPHVLSWNFFNSYHVKHSLFDLDGILSPNVPLEICKDEGEYVNFLKNVTPLYHRRPRLFKIKAIVTSRLEKFREVTEQWLDKHGVQYERLFMLPTKHEEDKLKNHTETASEFKAAKCRELRPRFFVESEIGEAKAIKKKYSFVSVVCPNHNVYF